jgi:hypothetical protein
VVDLAELSTKYKMNIKEILDVINFEIYNNDLEGIVNNTKDKYISMKVLREIIEQRLRE